VEAHVAASAPAPAGSCPRARMPTSAASVACKFRRAASAAAKPAANSGDMTAEAGTAERGAGATVAAAGSVAATEGTGANVGAGVGPGAGTAAAAGTKGTRAAASWPTEVPMSWRRASRISGSTAGASWPVVPWTTTGLLGSMAPVAPVTPGLLSAAETAFWPRPACRWRACGGALCCRFGGCSRHLQLFLQHLPAKRSRLADRSSVAAIASAAARAVCVVRAAGFDALRRSTTLVGAFRFTGGDGGVNSTWRGTRRLGEPPLACPRSAEGSTDLERAALPAVPAGAELLPGTPAAALPACRPRADGPLRVPPAAGPLTVTVPPPPPLAGSMSAFNGRFPLSREPQAAGAVGGVGSTRPTPATAPFGIEHFSVQIASCSPSRPCVSWERHVSTAKVRSASDLCCGRDRYLSNRWMDGRDNNGWDINGRLRRGVPFSPMYLPALMSHSSSPLARAAAKASSCTGRRGARSSPTSKRPDSTRGSERSGVSGLAPTPGRAAPPSSYCPLPGAT